MRDARLRLYVEMRLPHRDPTRIESRYLRSLASSSGSGRRPAPEHQRSVHATEGEVIAHDMICLNLTSATYDVVELAAMRIEIVEIQCGREPAVLHHLDAEPRLER